ncbi:FBD-associated F-box protein At4g10400-like, partial [Hordeum vulgare subsp. vulgare]
RSTADEFQESGSPTSDSRASGDRKSRLAGGQTSAEAASQLFDGMTPAKRLNSAPQLIATDRIGALPDNILHHMLSFLPAQAAVRTCVLAHRWRHLWRSTTGLRIGGLDDEESVHVQDIRKFVDHLLILRERTDLDTVEIKFHEFLGDDEPYVNLWIRFAVMNKVRVLTLHNYDDDYLYLHNLPLGSRYLRTLDLDGIGLEETFLDFAGCPLLETLSLDTCHISGRKISSPSLKHLSITICSSDLDCRIRVAAPVLVSLILDDFSGLTPFLENMPLLETANLYIGSKCKDVCLKYDSGVFCGANNNTCENCVPTSDSYGSDCVLLGGISSAKRLVLKSKFGQFIFSRDLKHCPTFSKLKFLLLDGYWCEAPDLDPLSRILKNSPVLEELTLVNFRKGQNPKVEMKGSYSSMKRSPAISEHLKIVEVKCNVVDEKILKVLRFLSAFNIRFSFH